MSTPPAWDKKMDKLFLELWNDPTLTVEEMARRIHKTPNALSCRATWYRKHGRDMLNRTSQANEPPLERKPPFVMPEGMSYEDDPRAISTGQPRLMIAPSIYRRSASSSLAVAMDSADAGR